MKKMILSLLLLSSLPIITSQKLSNTELLKKTKLLLERAESKSNNPEIKNILETYKKAKQKEIEDQRLSESYKNFKRINPYLYGLAQIATNLGIKHSKKAQTNALRTLEVLCKNNNPSTKQE